MKGGREAWTEGPEKPGDQLWWLTPGDIVKRKCTRRGTHWRVLLAAGLVVEPAKTTGGRFTRFGPQNLELGLVVWASKPLEDGFPGLGLKTWKRGLVVEPGKPLEDGLLGLGLKTQERFPSLGHKTRAAEPMRAWRHVAASGGLRRGEAKDAEGAWPSDHLPQLPRVGSQAAAQGGSLV